MLALEIEVCDLLQRIDGPKARVELDAVDDLDAVSEPDVFRPQVPVAVNDAPPPQAVKQHSVPLPEKLPQHPVAMASGRLRQAEAAVKQYACILLDIEFPLLEIALGGQNDGIRVPVEARKLENDGIEARTVSLTSCNEVIEHAPLVEAAHLHEPIDGDAALANCEALGRNCQGNGAQINVAGEPPIEFHLRAACHLPLRERGKIEIGEADRLLQFEYMIPSKEHPRHVGLPDFDFLHGGAIGAGVAQKRDLFLKLRGGELPSPGAIPVHF
ncbi:MAG: hypothetical protein ACLPX9_03175 [Rhodomicrobium sp.]